MIKPQERFISEGQCYFSTSEDPKARTECNVWDWDQLRMIKVIGTAKLLTPYDDKEVPILAQIADYLSPEVRAITVDDDGLLSGVSTDPMEDDTMFVPYLPFSTVKALANCHTVQYSKLQGLDRLAPGIDLISYEDESGNPRRAAFKFNPYNKPRRLQMAWDELNVLRSLPPHPNLLLLDRVVLEDTESRQLIKVVDFLNLEMGIMHQDIAPRNLLIDPDTRKILLFDFNWVACGKKGILDSQDDVFGIVLTLYELITNDTQFTSIPPWERNMDMLPDTEWPCNRELDADVSTFRNFLNDWVKTRKSDGAMERYLNAPNRLTWPNMPTAPGYDIPFEIGKCPDGELNWVTSPQMIRTAMEMGQYGFRWERPPQSRMLKKAEIGI